MKPNIVPSATVLVAVALSSCVTPSHEVVQTHWGRCGELAKVQYFSTNAVRRLEKEVFFGFQGAKVMELQYDPPVVQVRIFGETGKVLHIEKRNLSHLAHANRGRPDFELLSFPVISETAAGYTRVDYFDYTSEFPDGLIDTVVYFHKDKYPEDPFDKIQKGMTRHQVEHLAGTPVLSEVDGRRVTYYSGISQIVIDYDADKVAEMKAEIRKRYE